MKNEKYQFHSFLTYPQIIHGISTKAFGSIKNKNLYIDRERLLTFAKSLGITDPIVCMQQVHSGNVAHVRNAETLRILETDSMVTSTKQCPLAVVTADCLPILFYEPKKEVIGIAHAGYKGLLCGIIKNTVKRFVADFGSNPADIIVGIGPGIEAHCYEVGKEVIDQFEKTFPLFNHMFEKKRKSYFLDLRSIAQQCLIKEGILKKQIEVMDVCTKCNENFYSYRDGDANGRFASVISFV